MKRSVLAITVQSGRAGYVLMHDGKVQDWGATVKAANDAVALAGFLRSLLVQYRPDVVVTEKLHSASRKGNRTKAQIAALAREAAQHEVLDVAVTRRQRYANKFEEAVALGDRHPALAGHVPSRRPLFYESSPRGYLLFEAVAMAEEATRGSQERES